MTKRSSQIGEQATVTIRSFESKDRDVALKILLDGFSEFVTRAEKPILYEGLSSTRNNVIQEFDDVRNVVLNGDLFVATDEEDEVVGMVGMKVTDKDMVENRVELVRMTVSKRKRGAGIGRRLIEHLLHKANGSTIHLTTVHFMEAAQKMYKCYGFVEMGRSRVGSQDIDSDDYADVVSYERPILAVGITIRNYRDDDHDATIELYRPARFDEVNQPKDSTLHASTVAYCDKMMGEFDDVSTMVESKNGGRVFLAVNKNDQIVGVIDVVTSDEDIGRRRAQIRRLSVCSKQRRKGIGRKLIEHVLGFSRNELRLDSIWTELPDIFGNAKTLYGMYGFKEVSRRRHEGVDVAMSNECGQIVVFEKRL